MNFRTVRTILAKELLDTLRDKRTLIMMLGIPVLLYPALMLIGVQVAIVQHQELEMRVARIGLKTSGREANNLAERWLAQNEKIKLLEVDDPESALQLGDVDVVLLFPDTPQTILDSDKTLQLTLLYDGTAFRSFDAMRRLEGFLMVVSQQELQKRLEIKKLDAEFATPFQVKKDDIAPPEKATGALLGMILPMIMVMMIAMGAFYPAVDLTAGEKERGTFESLLATPASSLDIVAGKFLAVFTLAMCTGLLNLGSMAATFMLLLKQVSPMLEGDIPLSGSMPFYAFLIILVVMVPLAFFISAVMMSIAVYARSFKEAQNYVTPFFLVILLPSAVAGLPVVELKGMMQFLPVGNVVLLFKALMTGEATLEATFAVFTSTALFAALALLVAVWLFQREDIILAEDHGLPFTFRRSAFTPRDVPSTGAAFGLFAVVMLLIVYLGSLAQSENMIYGLLLTEWVLIFLPVTGVLVYARINLRKALLLYPVRPVHALATLLIALGALPIVLQIGIWHHQFLPMPVEMEEMFSQVFADIEGVWGFLLLFFVIAVSPAICEEVLFRGAMLSAVKDRWRPWVAVLVIGGLFGLFHLSLYRFIPTALLGVLLTYVVLRSGSIYTGVFLHFVNNASAIVLASGLMPQTWQDALGLQTIQDTGLPWWLLAMGTILLIAGVVGLERGRPVKLD